MINITNRQLENMSECEMIQLLKDDPFNIKFFKNPSMLLQEIAVTLNPETIKNINNPSEAVQIIAVSQNGYLLKYIENPSIEVQTAALINYSEDF